MSTETKKNDPILYCVKAIHKGKLRYFNFRDNQYYDNILNIELYASPAGVNEVIRKYMLVKAEIVEIRESELLTLQADLLTKITLMGGSLHNLINDLGPTMKYKSMQMRELKNNLNKVNKLLKPIIVDYNTFIKANEDSVDDVQGLLDSTIYKIAKMSFYDLNEIDVIFDAIRLDRDSIYGIAKKVVKNAKQNNNR